MASVPGFRLTPGRTDWRERTTLCGLGQSLLPTPLGIGKNSKSDAIRIRWPDGVIQAEVGVAACPVFRIEDYDRKPSSCPVLFTWDGEKYVFITDILGAGSVGESNPDGSARPPRPEESIKIEANQLKPKEGKYIIKLAEPMDEIMPVAPDRRRSPERCHGLSGWRSRPTRSRRRRSAFRSRHFPKSGRSSGTTSRTRSRTRSQAVDGSRNARGSVSRRTIRSRSTSATPAGQRHPVLCADQYAYPETIYGASRAGVEMQFRARTTRGRWQEPGRTSANSARRACRVMTLPAARFQARQTTFRIRH